MNAWVEPLRALRALKERNEPSFLVTVMNVRGSAPRDCGAKMLVSATDLVGSIGGGQLEYQCAQIACEQLQKSGDSSAHCPAFVRRFPLGASCGQCCGGVAEVLFERVDGERTAWTEDLIGYYRERAPVVVATAVAEGRAVKYLVTQDECREYGAATSAGLREAVTDAAREVIAQAGDACSFRHRESDSDPVQVLLEPVTTSPFNIALFGAGHVGSAVVAAMAGIDCNIRWVDSRRDIFPDRLPGQVLPVESASPEQEVAAMPAGSCYLVMTHSHARDFEICSRILDRNDFAYCGLIGSLSKRRRFEKLMRKRGMADALIERLTCPIGVAGIESKKPQAIAIAVAAQLLQQRSAAMASGAGRRSNLHVLRA